MSCPLDYSLCRQTVTVYRLEGDRVRRQVLSGVLYQYEMEQDTDQNGTSCKTGFTLIAPGMAQLRPGDRIYDGVGPMLTPQQWDGFLPVCIPGLSQIRYVRPCYWDGRLCHIQAGAD